MVSRIRAGVAVSPGQCNLSLFLRKETRLFRPIWQEKYRDYAKQDSRDSLLINRSTTVPEAVGHKYNKPQ